MKRTHLLLVTLLVIASLACSTISLGGNDQPDSSEGPGPVATVVVEPEEQDDGPTGEAPTSDVPAGDVPSGDNGEDTEAELDFDRSGLQELDSYRATLSYELRKADGTVETFAIEQAATRNPSAQRFTMSSADGDIEYIQIENQMWIRFGEEWIKSSSEEVEDDFGSFLTTSDDWVSEIDREDYEYLGKETVNGLSTKHYRVAYSAGWMNLLEQTDADGDIDDGTADLWIADEANLPDFLVRYRVELEGTLDGEEGSVTLSQDVTEVNEPISIEPPEGAATGGLPDGVPMYPDASEVTSFGTMTTFKAPDDVATVSEFYDEALTNAGWEKGEDGMEVGNMSTSAWTKDGEQLTLTVSADDDGVVTVMIIIGQ